MAVVREAHGPNSHNDNPGVIDVCNLDASEDGGNPGEAEIVSSC